MSAAASTLPLPSLRPAAPARAALRRALRAPSVAVAELLGLATATALGTLRGGEGVFTSAGFVLLTLLCCASLLVVLVDQTRTALALHRERLTERSFRTAPLRVAFERPARGVEGAAIATRGRAGAFGPPLFHAGLLLVILAGALRALFGAAAFVDLVEGETLAPSPSAWAVQSPGLFAGPIALGAPVTLRSVRASRHPDGGLKDLSLVVALGEPTGADVRELAINRELRLGDRRLFLGSDHGPAALLEVEVPGSAPRRLAVLLQPTGRERFEGTAPLPDGTSIHARAVLADGEERPSAIELRVLSGGALQAAALLRPGEALPLPAGGIALRGLPSWARLRGTRDAALPLALAGLLVVCAGAALMVCLVRVDTCVAVSPGAGGTEHVVVALRTRRFAALRAGEFAALVAAEGGPAR